MRSPRPMYRLLTVLFVASSLGAQSDAAARADTKPTTQPTTTFEDFVTAVDAAHRGIDNDQVHDRFDGTITITPLGKDADRIEIKLRVKFLGPKWLRYETTESGRTLERGIDKKGSWIRKGEKVESLGGREYETDRKSLRQHVRLARQLLKFLDPAATLRKLEAPSPVRVVEAKFGRLVLGTCKHVQGIIDGFPLYNSAGESARVRLDLWTKGGLVRALRATPLDDNDRVIGPAEDVLLSDYTESGGVQVPTLLTIQQLGEAPREPTPAVKISIEALELAPKLDAHSFTRPK